VCTGANATFNVVATGTGTLTYQWKKDGNDITGATGATYTITGVTAANAGSYTVVVTGTCGAVTSSAAALTINAGTTITTQPVAVTTCLQQNATFTVVAAGSGTLTYQWKKDGADIAAATSASYTVSNIVAGSAGNYSVVVTGGCGSVTSANAALTVSGPCTSIPNVNADITSVVLMPNVVNNSTTLRVTATRTMKINWNVVDMNGKVVMQFDNMVGAGQNDLQLRLAHLAAGNYYLMGTTQKGRLETVKFIRL
nr:T9SS type A sorting domain-containing protein [Flavisolibacter sp.]